MSLPPDVQQRAIDLVLGPKHRVLPHRRTWKNIDRRMYVDNVPDILAGVLRQFSTKMLDVGRLGIEDKDRYMVYRSSVFDIRDNLQDLLSEWLDFLGVTDDMGRIKDNVRNTLLDRNS